MTETTKKKRGPDPHRPPELLAWLKANAESVTVRAVTVPSITELVKRTGIPRRSLELALDALKAAGKLTVTRKTSRTGPVRLEVV